MAEVQRGFPFFWQLCCSNPEISTEMVLLNLNLLVSDPVLQTLPRIDGSVCEIIQFSQGPTISGPCDRYSHKPKLTWCPLRSASHVLEGIFNEKIKEALHIHSDSAGIHSNSWS